MTSKTSLTPPHSSHRKALLAALFMSLFAVAGCQEDHGISAAAKMNNTEASSQKEQIALGFIKEALGQQKTPQQELHQQSPYNQGTLSASAANADPETVRAGDNASRTPAPAAKERPTLRWIAPSTRVDGSRLSVGEIHSYRIYFKLRHRKSFKTITVPGANQTHLALSELSPGIYDFAITTLDNDGLESRKSDVLSVTII